MKCLGTGMGMFKQAETESAGRQLVKKEEGGTTVTEIRDRICI